MSDEESDEGELDEARNRESGLSDAQLGERELGENETIQETADRPPSQVTLTSPAVCNQPNRGTRKPTRFTDFT